MLLLGSILQQRKAARRECSLVAQSATPQSLAGRLARLLVFLKSSIGWRLAAMYCRSLHVVGDETCPLPDDPSLAAMALALNDAGYWAEIFDRDWRCVYMTDDARRIYGGRVELAPFPIGAHIFAPEPVSAALAWRGGQFPSRSFAACSAATALGSWPTHPVAATSCEPSLTRGCATLSTPLRRLGFRWPTRSRSRGSTRPLERLQMSAWSCCEYATKQAGSWVWS